jgi:hypothetical protein
MPDFRAGANAVGGRKMKGGKRTRFRTPSDHAPTRDLEKIYSEARHMLQENLSFMKEIWEQPFSPEANREAFLQHAAYEFVMGLTAFPEQRVAAAAKSQAIIDAALRGDTDARNVVNESLLYLIEGGQAVPEPLKLYTRVLLRGKLAPKKRGRSSHKNTVRDYLIRNVFTFLVMRGSNPTRSSATKEKGGEPSAASVLAELLAEVGIHMSESNVMHVCRDIAKKRRGVRN